MHTQCSGRLVRLATWCCVTRTDSSTDIKEGQLRRINLGLRRAGARYFEWIGRVRD